MRLRIDVVRSAAGDVISLHGELLTAGVEELERVSTAATMPLTLELSHLHTADQAGLAALLAARNRGVRLAGMSPYITLLLEDAGDTPGRRRVEDRARKPQRRSKDP